MTETKIRLNPDEQKIIDSADGAIAELVELYSKRKPFIQALKKGNTHVVPELEKIESRIQSLISILHELNVTYPTLITKQYITKRLKTL